MRRDDSFGSQERPAVKTLPPRDSAGPESLQLFLNDIRDTPVLAPEEEVALAQSLRDARERMLACLGRIPWVARELCRQYEERAAAGRVPSLLSEAGTEGDKETIRRAHETLTGLLEDPGLADPTHPGREALLERLAEAFTQFDPATRTLLDWSATIARCRRRASRDAERFGLTPEEMRESASQARRAREDYMDARDLFVKHNLRLVVHLAKPRQHPSIELGDLIQEGVLGLIRAVEKFDERRGFRFSTYAVWWIYQALIRTLQRDSRAVRLPANLYDQIRHLGQAQDRLRTLLGREPREAEVAQDLDLPEPIVAKLMQARVGHTSLDAPVRDDGELSLADALEDDDAVDPVTLLDSEGMRGDLGELLSGLGERDQTILRMRFGLGAAEHCTLQQVGDELGLSRERVRQLEKEALAKLAGEADERGLRELL